MNWIGFKDMWRGRDSSTGVPLEEPPVPRGTPVFPKGTPVEQDRCNKPGSATSGMGSDDPIVF